VLSKRRAKCEISKQSEEKHSSLIRSDMPIPGSQHHQLLKLNCTGVWNLIIILVRQLQGMIVEVVTPHLDSTTA
jgi:hypothetical protein